MQRHGCDTKRKQCRMHSPPRYTPRRASRGSGASDEAEGNPLRLCGRNPRHEGRALSPRRNDARFELITEYGFRGASGRSPIAPIRSSIAAAADGRRSSSTVSTRSRVFRTSCSSRPATASSARRSTCADTLVGFIDMRDKAGKAPFEAADLPKAQKIAERIARAVREQERLQPAIHHAVRGAAAARTLVPPSMPPRRSESAAARAGAAETVRAAAEAVALARAERSAPRERARACRRSSSKRAATPTASPSRESPETIGEAELAVDPRHAPFDAADPRRRRRRRCPRSATWAACRKSPRVRR